MVKKHPLSSAFHDYHLYEGYAATLKKKGLTKEAAKFSAYGNIEMATIKKIEKQRGIKAYTFGGKNNKPTDNADPKVKKELNDKY